MNLPAGTKIYRTDIAEFWFDEQGILYCNAMPTVRTIENIMESFKLVEKITDGKKVYLITDLTNTGAQSKKERDFAIKLLPRYYKAMGIISQSDFGRTMANIFLSLYSLPIPVKIFKTEVEAREWIKEISIVAASELQKR